MEFISCKFFFFFFVKLNCSSKPLVHVMFWLQGSAITGCRSAIR
jgi:hypothetical protein